MPGLSELHLLRPEWLWLAVPAALVVWLVGRSEDPLRPLRGHVAPHLLEHLIAGRERGFGLRPSQLAGLFLLVATLALAGPAWRRERPPFARDKASLVVALDLSRGMDAIDVSPTRLERAKQKLRDLLALREGARSGLVVYAGTAHVVLPPTEDTAILTTYLEALSPRLMPAAGKDAPAALALAESLLAREPVPGTILFVTDGISTEQAAAFAAHHRASANQVVALGVGTSEGGPIRDGRGFVSEGGEPVVARLDREGLMAVAREADALVATATLDDSDVKRIQRAVQAHMESAAQKDEGERYLDSGWYLVPLLALAAGFWFRRGWTVRWAAALFVAAFLEAPAEAADWSVADLFATRDQQGRRYFERGDFKSAAERFEDPHWKGVACYRAGDFACAIDALARVDTPEAWYDLGNAYARTGELKLALAAYDKALARRPGFPDAKANRDLVASKIPSETRDPEPQGREPSQKADEVKVDVEHLTDEQIAQMWLRGVQTSPAEFLRLKFAAQARDAKAGPPLAGSAPR